MSNSILASTSFFIAAKNKELINDIEVDGNNINNQTKCKINFQLLNSSKHLLNNSFINDKTCSTTNSIVELSSIVDVTSICTNLTQTELLKTSTACTVANYYVTPILSQKLLKNLQKEVPSLTSSVCNVNNSISSATTVTANSTILLATITSARCEPKLTYDLQSTSIYGNLSWPSQAQSHSLSATSNRLNCINHSSFSSLILNGTTANENEYSNSINISDLNCLTELNSNFFYLFYH